jgi:acetyl-CoA C-acetyltransferase
VSAVRTPIGSMGGAFKGMPGTALGTVAVKAAIERAGISGADVGEVLLGNVLPANSGQAPSRQVALGAGIPESVPCTDINKVCASGMKTIMLGAQSIMLGNEDVVVVGGFESMSNVPCYLPKGVPAYGHSQLLDGLLKDGLWDVYNDVHMVRPRGRVPCLVVPRAPYRLWGRALTRR